MIRKRLKLGIFLLSAALISLAAGCYHRKDVSDLHYIGHEGPDYYKDVATSIEYSSTQQERPEVVTASVEPHTIAERRRDQVWDLSLGQALQLALANNKIIRSAGAFTTPGNGLMSNPNLQPSVYDSAIQETGVLLGARGVEAALSDFDTTWTRTTPPWPAVWRREPCWTNTRGRTTRRCPRRSATAARSR
jgi:hypothetical protein